MKRCTKTEVKEMEKKKVYDIHDFNYDLLNDLRWKCPQTKKPGRGAFYTKKKPTKISPLFELKSIYEVIAVWKPDTNWNFEAKGISGDIWYKEFLIDRLSFKCNFTEIRIPDGGSLLLCLSEEELYLLIVCGHFFWKSSFY